MPKVRVVFSTVVQCCVAHQHTDILFISLEKPTCDPAINAVTMTVKYQHSRVRTVQKRPSSPSPVCTVAAAVQLPRTWKETGAGDILCVGC